MNTRQLYIGILTVPLNPETRYKKYCGQSYIVTAHLNWLESVGFKPVVIPFYASNLEEYIPYCNGLYLPSGGAFAQTQPEYYFASKKLIQLARKENNRGNYFPVWGCCMGMQQMLIEADGNDDYLNFLQTFDSDNNYKTSLIPYDDTKLFSVFPDHKLKEMTFQSKSLHNHMMGITPHRFNKSRLRNHYKIGNTSYDRKGKEFVSTIEGKKYPFYGVQWHPERKKPFHKLIEFFYDECLKSNSCKPLKQSLKTQKINCMKYSNELYKYCNFYWTENDSVNNPRNCKKADNMRENDGKKYVIIG